MPAPVPAIPWRDDRPMLGDEQHLAALEGVDNLHIREVLAWSSDTASTFLARFQSTAASLGPDERIKLEITYVREGSVELLKNVLADPRTSKVCALRWVYNGEDDVHSVIPLLINNCPELASLQVEFQHHSAFDFVSSVLEHPSNKVNVLDMSKYTEGDLPRFFAALAQSPVLALTMYNDNSPELCDYLAKDLLVRLKVWMDHKQLPSKMMMSLAACTRLVELKMSKCKFSQLIAFPQFITKLVFDECTFVGGFDWSFLVGRKVRELALFNMETDGRQLGRALAVHLRAKGLDKLRFGTGAFVNESLAVVGVELGRIKRLEIGGCSDASIERIALTLQSPNSKIRELRLRYNSNTMNSIENHLVPALRHPNCNLSELSLPAYQGHRAAAERVEETFHNRLALFVLLQGQQVKRKSPLRRLPVEMFRLVGEVLM